MRRVVITGIGLVTPLGNNLEATWQGLIEGRSGAGPITRFDTSQYATHFACEVKGWDSSPYLDKREAKHLDRFLHYAVGAGLMAMEDAGYSDRKVPSGEEERWGCFVGSGMGGIETIERAIHQIDEKGPRHGISPYFIVDIIPNMAPGLLSIKTGARGPNMAHVSACSTGAHSIGEATRSIRWGDTDVMIAGGSEAAICACGVGGFNSSRALSTRNDAPAKASRPFDKDRDGFVIGEGAGVCVLEELEYAKRRGAKIIAELAGYGMSGDAYHITLPPEDGRGAHRVMLNAITDAGIRPEEIGYINAHGTSTPPNDRIETHAIRQLFGAHANNLAVSSTKSMIGHLLGAAGAVEAGIASLVVERGLLPPTINYENPDP